MTESNDAVADPQRPIRTAAEMREAAAALADQSAVIAEDANVIAVFGKDASDSMSGAMEGIAGAIRSLPIAPLPPEVGALCERLDYGSYCTDMAVYGELEVNFGEVCAEAAATIRAQAAALAEGGWQPIETALRNDALLFEQFATNMRECWRGTGGLCEDGSASNDFRVWMNEAHNRARHLRDLIRSLPAPPRAQEARIAEEGE